MKQYRISKYNYKNRDMNGLYMKNEWTSYYDIGKRFNGKNLTQSDYIRCENNYINFCTILWDLNNKVQLNLKNIEAYLKEPPRIEISDEQTLKMIIRDILREKYWAKIEGKELFIHFGYDYYMYIGTNVKTDIINKLANESNLHCEEMNSPYIKQLE